MEEHKTAVDLYSKFGFFTETMALSLEAAQKIRLMLPGIIEQILSISGPSDSEAVRCLNIDWFEY